MLCNAFAADEVEMSLYTGKAVRIEVKVKSKLNIPHFHVAEQCLT